MVSGKQENLLATSADGPAESQLEAIDHPLQFKRQLEDLSRQGGTPKLLALKQAVLEHFKVADVGAPSGATAGEVSHGCIESADSCCTF